MHTLLQDLRYALRTLRRNPGFTIVAVLTLALGIGANSAIFSVVNSILLRPLPYPESDRLLTVFHFYPSLGNLEAGMAVPTYRDLREDPGIFEEVAVQSHWAANLTGGGTPERLTGSRVSGRYFSMLGVPPALGRGILPEEAENADAKVIVLSHGLWQRRFGSDPNVVGQPVQINGEAYAIVGVMPAGFRDPFNKNAEFWVPIVFSPSQYNARTSEFMQLTARLRSGASVERAEREMSAFAERLKADNPGSYPEDWTLRVRSLGEQFTGNIRPALLVLLGAVGFVLLIACANVANLLLARAAARTKEIAIRGALGAARRRLAQQLLVESLLLAVLGGALALLLAYGSVRLLVSLNPANLPRVEEVSLDGRVVLFTLAVAVLTGLIFGLFPALQASRPNLQSTLRVGGRGGASAGAARAVRRALVVAEFALALSLLVGAGLLLRSFARLQQVDPGFNPENLLAATLSLAQTQYPSDTARIAFFDEVLDRVAAIPGVQSAGATSVLPFSGNWSTGSFAIEGLELAEGQPNPWGDIRIVDPNFQRTMQIPLLRGRFFGESDRLGSPRVAVVDQEMVKRYWPDRDPIGTRIFLWGDTLQVVGVVGHTAHEGLDADPRVQLYLPYRQVGPGSLSLAIRTTGDPMRLVGPLRAAVRSVDPAQPISQVSTMQTLLSEAVGQRRFSLLLLGLFAGIALLLASIGIYGVISFDVARRTQEIGVRMALGAERATVLRLVLLQGVGLALLGVVIGLLGAFGLTRLLAAQLYGVTSTDPVTFAAVAFLLLAVAALAAFLPARRATRVDPMIALRAE